MSRAYAIAMQRPRVELGLPLSAGKKVEAAAKRTWIMLMVVVTAACIGMYLYQVNRAASKGFTLRTLERQLDQLETTVAELENTAATMQSLSVVEARVRGLGYVPVDHMEFVDVPAGYALAR